MATSHSRLPCAFIKILEDNFYFEVQNDELDLQSDCFEKSKTSSVHWLRVQDNLLLSVDGEQLYFVDLPKKQQEGSDCQFIVQAFNETPDSPPHSEQRGRAVTLAVMEKRKYKVVSCREGSQDIQVQIMDKLPEIIKDDDCWSLFYMKNFCQTSDHYLFVSAAKPKFALGFEQDGNPSICKLVLREYCDEVDEGCRIEVPLCQ